MKITNRLLYTQLNKDIARNTEKLFNLNGQISSGKRINSPSDDPLGLSNVLINRTELNMFTQYGKAIDYATGWLNRTESLLQDTDDILGRAGELAVQQSNATASAETRAGAAEEIKQLRIMIQSNSNAKYGNKYVFSGTRTQTQPYLFADAQQWKDDVSTLGTAPLTPAEGTRYINSADNHIYEYTSGAWVDQGAPAEGDSAIVTDRNSSMYVFDSGEWKALYQGNDSTFSLQIGRSSTVEVNIPGSSLFSYQQSDINMTLLRLEKALRSNDIEGIRAEISNIENASTLINNNLALVGANVNKLEHTETLLSQSTLDTKDSISTIEDLDYAEAITSLKNQQTIYQATLQSASMITGLSLVDYID